MTLEKLYDFHNGPVFHKRIDFQIQKDVEVGDSLFSNVVINCCIRATGRKHEGSDR